MLQINTKVMSMYPTQLFRGSTWTVLRHVQMRHRVRSGELQQAEERTKTLVETCVSEGRPLSSNQWKELRSDAVKRDYGTTDKNFPGVVMRSCLIFGHYKVAKSFLDYLEGEEIQPNQATLSMFARVCAGRVEECGEEYILKLCDQVISQAKVMDGYTAENMIIGLAATSRWREGLPLLPAIRVTCTPSAQAYNALAAAAFKDAEYTQGWDLLRQAMLDGKNIFESTYTGWLDKCNDMVMMETLLNFWRQYGGFPSKELALKLKEWFEIGNWVGQISKADLTGKCSRCDHKLEPIRVTPTEFKELWKAFSERVLYRKDVFLRTNPEELEKFFEFIKKTAPYRVVLDGLNIAYASRARSTAEKGRLLAAVVRHFARPGNKILIIGRQHMLSWKNQDMDYVRQNSEMFLADNISQDDPFLLYATLYSGLGTQFVSRDMMRNHAFSLGDVNLSMIFRRWQAAHQVELVYVEASGRVRVKAPALHFTAPQKESDTMWHIPFDDGSPRQGNEPPNSWLCLHKSRPRRKN